MASAYPSGVIERENTLERISTGYTVNSVAVSENHAVIKAWRNGSLHHDESVPTAR